MYLVVAHVGVIAILFVLWHPCDLQQVLVVLTAIPLDAMRQAEFLAGQPLLFCLLDLR